MALKEGPPLYENVTPTVVSKGIHRKLASLAVNVAPALKRPPSVIDLPNENIV